MYINMRINLIKWYIQNKEFNMEQLELELNGKKHTTTPFLQDAENETRTINCNGKDMPIAYWNLIVTKRDLSMWCKFGMKPNRYWKVSDVKKYFGITGTRENLYDRFIEMYGDLIPDTSKDKS